MLSTSDKKYISDTIKENNEILIHEVMDLFNTTNERIDKLDVRIDKLDEKFTGKIDDLNARIDKVLDQLADDDESINDHENRLRKVERKVFAT